MSEVEIENLAENKAYSDSLMENHFSKDIYLSDLKNDHSESKRQAECLPICSCDEVESLSHTGMRRVFQATLGHVLENDPVLSDLHPEVTLEEVKALIELEHGRAIVVFVKKMDGNILRIVVPRSASVWDLKIALKCHVALALNRNGVKKRISWKYIWKTYWLFFDGVKLTDDNKKLLDYGIMNRAALSFSKRFAERQKVARVNRVGESTLNMSQFSNDLPQETPAQGRF